MPEQAEISEEKTRWLEAPSFFIKNKPPVQQHPLTSAILGRRGLDEESKTLDFLQKSLRFLADPSQLADSEKAASPID